MRSQLDRDLANLQAACNAHGVEEAFIPAISPSDVVGNQLNEHYATEEEFLYAVSDALNVEYKAIVDAGFMLQIDDPRLINYYVKNPQLSVDECRKWAHEQVEAINHSLNGIPENRIRYHTCYGINMGPRVHDMEMKDYVDIILNIGRYIAINIIPTKTATKIIIKGSIIEVKLLTLVETSSS